MKRVIVDVDVGIDDYLAILLLLYEEKMGNVKIEAITCVSGNTTVENVCRNTIRLLELTGRTDIPVYKGAAKQIISAESMSWYHGEDGLKDLTYQNEPNMALLRDKPAAVAIYDIVKSNPGQIDLICLAPLTNVALTLLLYDDFPSYLKSVIIMGGNFKAVGNTTCCAEFNFYTDPEAAFVTLDRMICPTSILTWEACLDTSIVNHWYFDILQKNRCPVLDLLLEVEKRVCSEEDIWFPCDAFIVLPYLFPEKAILKSTQHNATVELNGTHTRGQLVLDHLKRKSPNVTIIELIEQEYFKEALIKMAEWLSSNN